MFRISFFALGLLLLAAPVLAEDFVGSVRTLKGEAEILRQGETVSPKLGDYVYQGDELRTGDGSLGVMFRDDTSIALGPRTDIVVDEFVFDPAGKNVRFATEMVKGSALFVTGQIARVNPEAFSLGTPKANIGIRGTKFLVTVK
ncbi:MAG: FecR domain-containing protein [Desulfovibrionaceae bacterium]